MAISKYACYKYDSAKHLLKQGSLDYDSVEGKYTFSDTLANINQGEINETQIVIAVSDGSYDDYFPYITVKAPKGWTTQPLSMVKADITIIEDEVETLYQVATIDLSLVGLTRYAGIHTFVIGWLTNGTYVTLDGAKYTVDDGVNDYENIEADNYEDIYASLELTFVAYADRLIAIENFVTGGLGYLSGQTDGIRELTLYNADNTAILTYNGTDIVWNYRGVEGEMFKNLFLEVEAASGVTFTEGMLVMYAGSVGGSGKCLGKPTDLEELQENPCLFMGMVTEVLSDGGAILNWYGDLNNLNTSTATLGTPVYVGDNGVWTTTKPVSPLPQILVGLVERVSSTVGRICVRPYIGSYLGQLHDVYTNGHTYTDKDLLVYNLANARWQPMTKAEYQAITANLNMATYKITNLGNGTNSADAVNKGQLDTVDDKVVALETANMFKSVSYASATGILTFTKFDNTTVAVDFPLELIIQSGSYDEVNNDIVLVLADSSEIRIPVDNLLTDLDGSNVRYSNTTSGLTADDIQAAIDELVVVINALTASEVAYDNTDSDLVATDVKSALDELDSGKLDKDFSGYDELLTTEIVDDDYIVIRDVSTNTTKKAKVSTLNNYIGETYEYGVRRVYSPTMQTSSTLERVMKVNGELIVGAATGLEFNVGIDDQVVTNSFDNIDIFQFEEVVINGNDFIKFPKRFTKHEYVVDGATTYEYWWQCANKLTGYSSLVFDRYGTGESDYAYIGKYKMVDIGGVGKSAAGYYPNNSLNMDAARTKARKNDGDGTNTTSKYGLVDRAERYELIEVPFYIITATLHSQSVLVGVTNLIDANTVADSTVDNTAIVANASATLFKTDMCIYLSTDSKYHVITAIDVDTPIAGQTTITFDGDTVLPLTGANLNPRAYKTGLTTGVKASFGAYRANTGYDPITILGLEDIYGGMWEGVDGVKVNDWYPFFNNDPSTYSNAASSGGLFANYTKADFQIPNANGYIKDMGFDDRFKNSPMPIEVGGSNATYYADYFSQASGDRMFLVGGTWNSSSYAGMAYWHVSYTLTTFYFSVGFRLSYRP
jgi:hypothetical protein